MKMWAMAVVGVHEVVPRRRTSAARMALRASNRSKPGRDIASNRAVRRGRTNVARGVRYAGGDNRERISARSQVPLDLPRPQSRRATGRWSARSQWWPTARALPQHFCSTSMLMQNASEHGAQPSSISVAIRDRADPLSGSQWVHSIQLKGTGTG